MDRVRTPELRSSFVDSGVRKVRFKRQPPARRSPLQGVGMDILPAVPSEDDEVAHGSQIRLKVSNRPARRIEQGKRDPRRSPGFAVLDKDVRLQFIAIYPTRGIGDKRRHRRRGSGDVHFSG